MKDNFETLQIKNTAEFVVQLTLDRPEVSNAFNTKMAEELILFLEDAAMHPTEIRTIIVTGAGDRAFCAGGDLKQRHDMNNAEWFSQHLVFERMTRAFIDCPIPLIAAVNGAAYGGGCELAAACDFIYASSNAKFALPETTLGIIPGAGGTQTVSRAIGTRRAKELIFTGRVFSAQDAYKWGLVNEILDPGKLLPHSQKVATKIADNAPIAVRQAKVAISRASDLPLTEALRFEIEAYNRTVSSKDRYQGIRAFNEKRKPKFTDE